MCIFIGFFISLLNNDLMLIAPNLNTLFISAISGVATAIFVVTWLINVRKNAYMMLDIFLMFGTLIPLILSSIIFNEKITLMQWFWVLILFVAVIIMCSYNNTIKGKITFYSFLLLAVFGISYGISDFTQKLFTKNDLTDLVKPFNFTLL